MDAGTDANVLMTIELTLVLASMLAFAARALIGLDRLGTEMVPARVRRPFGMRPRP
ncbi:MAG: hypothetical protein HXX10_23685 [Rhodoplanes sp.]|uniref:hypothetical protein n=1 Tax=Rhodoplanes sp. TaxID=1968906 RepID=UPI00180BDB05|nr:hypothetical protein [Rhodoplanes sp.]NVO17038.1 hypothetical protein [Rhodoplanes sp.]